jgi:pimeloyl-ACP methyl ester carboxylesterase
MLANTQILVFVGIILFCFGGFLRKFRRKHLMADGVRQIVGSVYLIIILNHTLMKQKTTLCFWVSLLLFTFGTRAQSTDEVAVQPCKPCADLEALRLPDVRILTVESRQKPVAHCKVAGIIGKEINFEVVLPDAWNARFSMSGNGGFAGAIQTGHRRVKQGYANAATDTGHEGAPLDASWAFGHPERQLNFGHLAVHRTAVTAKEIIRQYYCEAPAYSYFVGCSRGGGQAMMAAQRYPEDFDGIVAGAPAFNWPAVAAEIVQNCQSLFPNEASYEDAVISPDHLRLLQAHILDQCDTLDGIKDQILNDPRDCVFDFSKLPRCPNDQPGADCFTPQQIEAIKTVYAGVDDGERSIYPGFPLGGEYERGGWQAWITGPDNSGLVGDAPSKHFRFGTQIFQHFVFHDTTWDYRSYDFQDFFPTTRFASSFLDATNTDYRAFTAGGGKMLIYHGWNDPALSALATIEHYETAKVNPELDDHIRLFLLPGVLHCGGGPGPSQTNWLQYVRDWVEKGEAPERIVLTRWEENGQKVTRPVFPYPDRAAYDGEGDPRHQSSFKREKPAKKE